MDNGNGTHFSTLLSEFVYVRTYARWLDKEKRRETWPETVKRYVDYYVRSNPKLQNLTFDLAGQVEQAILNKDVMPSMRSLWCAGPAVDRDHTCSYNCSFIPIDNLKAFAEALYILMCGTGVGFSVERTFVDCLPTVSAPTGESTSYVIEDSTEGWADSLHYALVEGHRGHKVWFDYSKIRPKGARLRIKGGTASGPEPLERVHNFVASTLEKAVGRRLKPIEAHDIMCMIAEIVMVGGFRRASLISFSDPDDIEMRHAKDWRQGNVPAIRYMANNSAVWFERPSIERFREEWQNLVDSGSGERGFSIMNWDKRAPRGTTELRSNPCVTGDTRVLTASGYKMIQNFLGVQQGIVVDSRFGTEGVGHTTSQGAFKTGEREVFELATQEGYKLKLTGDHKVMTPNGWVPAGKLAAGDKIHILNQGGGWGHSGSKELGAIAGWLAGDGCLLENGTAARLYFYGEKRELALRFVDYLNGGKLTAQDNQDRDYIDFKEAFRVLEISSKTEVPNLVWEGTKACQAAYLSALFSADGSIQGTQKKGISVRLSSVDLEHLRNVQLLLLNFGIYSKIYQNRQDAGYRMLPDGRGGLAEYACQAAHELVIANAGVQTYSTEIGFMLRHKAERLATVLSAFKRRPNTVKYLATVESLVSQGVQTVYDLTENTTHSFSANGVVVHNCHEIGLRFKRALNPWTGEGGGGQFCVAGDTPLITKEGLTTLQEAVGRTVHVWNGVKWSAVTPRKTGSARQLYRVHFSDGSYLDTTAHHSFSVTNKNLRSGWHKMQLQEIMADFAGKRWRTEPFQIDLRDGVSQPAGYAYTAGVAVGDGWIRKTDGSGRPNPRVYISLHGEKDIKLPVVGVRGKRRVANPKTSDLEKVDVFCPEQNPEFIQALKDSPDRFCEVFTWCRADVLEFLAGLLDADGCNQGGRVRLYVSQERRARVIQLLLTRCGIRSSIGCTQKAGAVTNMGPRTADMWHIDITDCASIPCRRLDTSGGHAPRFKSKYQTIRAIEPLPELHDTYCFEEPERHMAVFGNTLTYQCNLTAAVVRPWDTQQTLAHKVRLATWLGCIQASYTHFPYLRPAWKQLCDEDRLLGVDLTGQCDNPELTNNEGVLASLNTVARMTAAHASMALDIREPVAITCGKPSGNSSQLVDCASGFHPRYAPYYFRHVRVSAKDPLFKMIRDYGVPVFKENGQEHLPDDKVDVWVVRFPVKSPEGAMLRDHETALEQCERYLRIMRTWCGIKGHNQSATIYVRPDEWWPVGQWLYQHFDQVTGLSFLPHSDVDTKYRLLPYQEITKEQYETAVAELPHIDFKALRMYETDDEGEGASEPACVGGACEL